MRDSEISNIPCPKCGQRLFRCELVHHIYYRCYDCEDMYKIKGDDTWFNCPEIDLTNGVIIDVEGKIIYSYSVWPPVFDPE